MNHPAVIVESLDSTYIHQPDFECSDGSQDCLRIDTGENNAWQDNGCNEMYHALCEASNLSQVINIVNLCSTE